METQTPSVEEKALIQAAKIICGLKSGLCPIYEPDFTGCTRACTEDIRPWQCWCIHLRSHARQQDQKKTELPLKQAA